MFKRKLKKNFTEQQKNEVTIVLSTVLNVCAFYLYIIPFYSHLYFEFQIELAIELDKPLFVHERDAHDDLITILDQFKTKLPAVLIHCFTGTAQQALAYLDKGFYIGLTGRYAVIEKCKIFYTI